MITIKWWNLHEIHASGRSNNGATFMNDWADWRPISFFYIITAIHHALISLADEVHLTSQVDTHSYHRTYRRIHTLGVPTACKYSEAFPFMGTSFDELLRCPVHSYGLKDSRTPYKIQNTNYLWYYITQQLQFETTFSMNSNRYTTAFNCR